MDVTQLAFTWVGYLAKRWKTCVDLFVTLILTKSEHKSSQVNAGARKTWPNGVASRPKFSTCDYLRVVLARSCVLLRWLAMNCAHFGQDQSYTQVEASLSPSFSIVSKVMNDYMLNTFTLVTVLLQFKSFFTRAVIASCCIFKNLTASMETIISITFADVWKWKQKI